MPEQLTRHPEVTLQVLRSAGARCGEGLAPAILKQCPTERFCRLPGGELCVYGLPEAGRMTQVSAAEWRTLAESAATGPPTRDATGDAGLAAWTAGLGLLIGLLLGYVGGRPRRAAH
jgi:hypothetical protein